MKKSRLIMWGKGMKKIFVYILVVLLIASIGILAYKNSKQIRIKINADVEELEEPVYFITGSRFLYVDLL